VWRVRNRDSTRKTKGCRGVHVMVVNAMNLKRDLIVTKDNMIMQLEGCPL